MRTHDNISVFKYQVPDRCSGRPVRRGNGLPGTPPGNEDTVASLGSNGLLGIGGLIFDCGNDCTTVSFTSGYPYYICPNGTCQAVAVPTSDQAVNPVAQFTSTDNNGVMITLPAIASSGAVTVSGTMNFGIATRTDNALGNAKIYALDQCGNFPTVTFNGATYSDTQCTSNTGGMGGFLDTGSNALYVSDANTLKTFGISDCASGTAGFGFYCVSGGTATLSNINLIGFGGVGSAVPSDRCGSSVSWRSRSASTVSPYRSCLRDWAASSWWPRASWGSRRRPRCRSES